MDRCDMHDSISGYLDDELSASVRQEFEEHLTLCSTCREILRDLVQIRGELQLSNQAVVAPAETVEAVMQHIASGHQVLQMRRVSKLFAGVLGLVFALCTGLLLSPAGLLVWPMLHLITSVLRGLFGFRHAVGAVWAMVGACVAVFAVFAWARFMQRLLRESQSEVAT